MGYVRVAKGHNALKLEEQCSWAVPDTFTAFPDVGEAAGAEGRLPAWRTVPRQPASKGRAAPAEPTAPPQQLGSSPPPQELASGCPTDALFPTANH